MTTAPRPIERDPLAATEELEDRLVAQSLAAGDPTSWLDTLYRAGEAGEMAMPWSRLQPHPPLAQWTAARRLNGCGRRALVVGCGLGADAEHISGLGDETIGFDVSPTATRLAKRRFTTSGVEYVTADLLDPPVTWRRVFDLVVEVITVQALPHPFRHKAIENVGRFVAVGGTLIVIAAVEDGTAENRNTAPWPLRRDEIDEFGIDGLTQSEVELLEIPAEPGEWRWRAEYHR